MNALAASLSHLAFLPPLAQVNNGGGAVEIVGGGVCLIFVLAYAALSLAGLVWVIVDVVKRSDLETGMKIVWILVAWFLNLLGVALYYFIGRKPGGGAGSV